MRNRVRRALRSVLASRAFARKQARVARRKTNRSLIEVEGVIKHVDPVGRELPVIVDGVCMNFFVPIQCTICMNDERVKLQLLQPQDRARLAYSVEHGITTAHSITVATFTAAPL